jgi:hypothetical protein
MRDMGGFLVISAYCILFRLQDLCFFLRYFVAFTVYMLSYFDFSSRPCARSYFCFLMRTYEGLIVSPMYELRVDLILVMLATIESITVCHPVWH